MSRGLLFLSPPLNPDRSFSVGPIPNSTARFSGLMQHQGKCNAKHWNFKENLKAQCFKMTKNQGVREVDSRKMRTKTVPDTAFCRIRQVKCNSRCIYAEDRFQLFNCLQICFFQKRRPQLNVVCRYLVQAKQIKEFGRKNIHGQIVGAFSE